MNPTQQTISTTQKRNQTISVCGSTFTGMEKDSESGYHYFGARYYDSELLTGWLSVDPMSDKYPSLSPYNYCAWTRPTGGDEHRWIKYNIVNNPVKLVDPDGKEIWITNSDGLFKYTAGMSSEGLNGFAKKAVDALNDIYYKGSDEGVDLINTLCSSENTFKIKEQEIGKVGEFIAGNVTDAYARCNPTFIDHWQDFFEHGHKFGSGGDVMWNTKGYMIITEKGLRNDPTYQLLHELCHAYDANFGMMDYRFFNELEMKEWSACLKANCIGSSMGFPQQTIYKGSVEKTSGRYMSCSGTALFDDGGPINPFIDF